MAQALVYQIGNSKKGTSLFISTHMASWMFCLATTWGSISQSLPVIAGVHGRGAGIGTVNKVINDNPHDRWGPLKLPVMQ